MKKDISELKKLIAAFSDSDFGEPIFSPEPEMMPETAPPVGKHPRMGFTGERLKKILHNVDKGDNKYAYSELMRLSDIECDGIMRDFENHDVCNNVRAVNCEVHNIILCKAFRYAAFGEEIYGYEAIYALKNYLTTCTLRLDEAFAIEYHISLTMTSAMSMVGCVYDWCYPLLTDRDKKHLVGAATSKCAANLEFPEYPPQKGGGVCGHQSGPPFLTGWVPFVLAVYDEYPQYYNIIFDLMLHTIVPGQNYVVQSGFHGQGIAYGASRLSSLMKSECWFSYMYDNKKHLFSDMVEQACLTFIKAIRPDGETLRIGDDFFQGRRFSHTIICALLGAGLYKNPVLKDFANRQTDEFSLFWMHGLNPIDVLLFNDAEVPKQALDTLPLISCYGDPTGAIIAKTEHNNKNAGMVYMKIGTSSTSNHEHKDCGDFQIYHNGMLISSSGCYNGYGSEHDMGYYKQTISKNSILVYNPAKKDNDIWLYSGGQRIDDASNAGIASLEDWIAGPNYNRAKTFYMCGKTSAYNSKEKFEYCAIGGDLTNAYDEDTVSEVKRHMVCLSTNKKVNPMVFVIFDKITSVDESFKKTLLLHTLNAPLVTEVNNKPCSVVTNLMSRLYIQSLLTEVDHTFVGGEGNEFSVNGKNCSPYFDGRVEGVKNEYNTEYGFGRIEISPKNPAKENSFITVMYVAPDTDCSPYLDLNTNILQPYHEAVEIGDENTVGAAILGSAVLFASNGEYIEDDICVKLPEGVERCLICGIKPGTWIDDNGNKYVADEKECALEISAKEKLVLKKA